MAYVYKKFLPQDKATIPFNAHKQYNFVSSSAASNKVTYYSAIYTSESISNYSSASSAYGGDTKNNIKYNQIDHLFYRDHLKKVENKKDFIGYKKQQKNLYEKLNILSIPSGLYGQQIKKTSFYLSASQYEVIDDSFGNLIISGTNLNNYPTNPHYNVFRLDPIKGFKKHDLGVYDGYVKVIGESISDVNQRRNNVSSRKLDRPSHQRVSKQFYRRGSVNPDALPYYTSDPNRLPKNYYPKDVDDSYFFNSLEYHKVRFQASSLGDSGSRFSSIRFDSISSSFIKIPHNQRFNFNTNDNFSISFYLTPEATSSNGAIDATEKRYIIAKSGTKTIVNKNLLNGSKTEDVNAGAQYPFEIYMKNKRLYFSRSDGNSSVTIDGEITSSTGDFKTSHILCQNSASTVEIYFDGTKIASQAYTFTEKTQNKANLYIGSKGHQTTNNALDVGIGQLYIESLPNNISNNVVQSQIGAWTIGEANPISDRQRIKYFNGNLSNINIWSKAFNTTQITNISESINASPYIGNIFYQSGLATITHPKYYSILRSVGIGSDGMVIDSPNSQGGPFIVGYEGINKLQFQGSHLIYEHEYHCVIQDHEFHDTTNNSARNRTGDGDTLANFATSSIFTPYVTTIGLYNEMNELLVVAKLGQPTKLSKKTDTTFVVRWDT
jgi:hypothetical protein